MSALLCFCLVSLFALTISNTIIGNGAANQFEEDWAYDANEPGATESWWTKGSSFQEDLGSIHGAETPQDGPIWGWWRADDGDSGNQFLREFVCTSQAHVYVSYDVYFCINGNSGSQTTQWYYRTATGTNNIQYVIEYGKSGTGYTSWDTNVGTGLCGSNVQKATVTDDFDTEPDYPFTITITKKLSNAATQGDTGDNNYDDQLLGMNNVVVRCEQIVTDNPTPAPSSQTGNPSTTPTKAPTPAPTDDPTPAPTEQPTTSPTSPQPTKTPTTAEPTASPSKTPIPAPTGSPTRKPTEAPTKRPTGKPSGAPTVRPTSAVPLGRQFSNALGITENAECDGSWTKCNPTIFILFIVIIIFACCYWILGAVWFKRRQNNRPLPAHLGGDKGGVEFGGAATHATSDKWKSAWEQEQEQQ